MQLLLHLQCLQQQLCCRQLRKKVFLRALQDRLHFPFFFSRILWLFLFWQYFLFLHLNGLSESSTIKSSLIGNLPGWMQGLSFFAAVAVIYFGGRYLFVPLLRIVAKTGLRELFTASSLLLVVSVAMLMQAIGLSPALGTFLAGVVLANSEYRHELESDLEPFKGLLLGLFFIGVGASINFDLIGQNHLIIFGLVIRYYEY